MSRFADLVIKEDRTPEEDQELHVLAQQLDYVVADVGTAIGPSGVINRLRAGSVVLDNAGVHTYLGGVETGRIEADGDFLLGSNIATAANTSFAVFSNAQTYNSESIGAGDLLIGDNTASKANILWDKSTGQLLFRGGTTTQGYIDTDGSAVFGAGDVRLGAGGIVFQTGQSATNQILWEDAAAADGTNYGAVYTYHVGATPNKFGYMVINVGAEAGGNASSYLNLQAFDANDSTTGTIQLFGGEKLQYIAQAATDNNIVNMVSFERTLSGNAADGFGFRTNFILDDDSSTKQYVGQIQTKWTDVSEAMARMDFFFPNTNTSFLAFDMLTASTFEMIMNDSGLDMDFRVETDGNEYTIFAEGSTNRVGILTSSPDGTLHVHTATAGSVTANTNADDLIVESDRNAGISILTPNTNVGWLGFGAPENAIAGFLQYVHSSGEFVVGVEGIARYRYKAFELEHAGQFTISSTAGNIILAPATGIVSITGTLDTEGFIGNTVEKSSGYTATATDYAIMCDASGGGFAITLPAAASHTGRVYHIKKIDSSGNIVTVDGNSSETIDDATTAVLTTQYEAITIQCDGDEWFIL